MGVGWRGIGGKKKGETDYDSCKVGLVLRSASLVSAEVLCVHGFLIQPSSSFGNCECLYLTSPLVQILRRLAELDGMPILVRVAHPPTAAASQDLSCLRSIALLGARFSRYLDFLVCFYATTCCYYVIHFRYPVVLTFSYSCNSRVVLSSTLSPPICQVPQFLANKPQYQLLNALISRGDPFICLQVQICDHILMILPSQAHRISACCVC